MKTKADVIKALRCCIVRNPDDRMRCTECPYMDPGTYCLNRLKHDALAWLEAGAEASGCGDDWCEIAEDAR